MEKIVIELGNYGMHIGNRFLGRQIREEIQKIFQAENDVILDLAGVKSISESFADECFAKLLNTYSVEDIRKRVTYRNAPVLLKGPIYAVFREKEKQQKNFPKE